MLGLKAEAGTRPGGRGTCSLLRQRKVPKRKATPSLRPLRCATGQPASGRLRGAPWNSLCAGARRSDNHGESVNEAWALRRPCSPRNRPEAGAASRGLGIRTSNSRIATRAIAALGPACAARGACAPEMGPSKAMACVDVLPPVPLWMRRGAQGLADQGSRVSERRAAARVERDPVKPEHRRLPRSVSAGDADSGVALSLVPFFRRRERKGLACRATPGLRP